MCRFYLKVSRLESEHLCICFPGKTPIGGDDRVRLHPPGSNPYDVSVAFIFIPTSVCLFQPFHNSSCFLRFGKLILKSYSRWAREQRKMSRVSEHWFIIGNRRFILKTSSIHLQTAAPKGKKCPPSPPLHAVRRKKNEETLFLASPPRLICIPVFLEKEPHDWWIKVGGNVVSGNLRVRHQPQ